MTDTTTTHEEAEAVAVHALGELSHIDPNSLEVGENVREYANVDKPFLDSIAEHGVLVPITAIRRRDGGIEVRNGSLSSSVLLSVRVARQSAVEAVIGQGEITRDTAISEGSVWVVMTARTCRLLGGSFSIVLALCLRLFSTMRSRGRIGMCLSERRDGCEMVSRFSSGRVGWSMSG